MVATNVGWRFGALARHIATAPFVSAAAVTELYRAVAASSANVDLTVDVDASAGEKADPQSAPPLRSLHELWAQTSRVPAAKAGLFQVPARLLRVCVPARLLSVCLFFALHGLVFPFP